MIAESMPAPTTIRIWDLPTRLFHWALAVCVTGSYITVKLGGLWMDWHVRFGLVALGLISFRIIWGLIGPRYARFSQFVHGPRYILNYLRGKTIHHAGHSPLGALSVIALLAAFGFQAVTGLFANDDVMTTGPLAYLSDRWSDRLTGLHDLNEWVLIGLVVLHVGAIAWYRIARHKNLVGPMIHGDVTLNPEQQAVVPGTRDSWPVRLGALAIGLAIAAAVWWITTLAPAGDFMS
jgi:cytochrome b